MNPRARREPPKKRGRLRARSIVPGTFVHIEVAMGYEAILAAEGLAVIERPESLPFSHPKIPDDAVIPCGFSRPEFINETRAFKLSETARLVGLLEDVLWGHIDAPPLSDRERAALELYLDGLTTRQIAQRLRGGPFRAASRETVETVLRGICERHGLPPLRFERSE